MHFMDVDVYFGFGIKDFSTIRTHILSRSCGWGASSFNDLAQT
jgi:hypothetical protein